MESHSDHDSVGTKLDETSHTIFLGEFENKKKYKEQIVREIAVAICAMLNTNGGKVVIHVETDGSDVPVEGSPFSKLSSVIRILEQFMISIIGENQTVSNINFRDTKDCIIIFIKKAGFLITIDYNLYLPSQTQVVEVSPWEPLENIKNDIMHRKVIPNPVQLGSHCRTFRIEDKNCGLHESKTCQLKNVKAGASKRTTLADRMTGKGNKFNCYVSAFANHSGGHIYYGITSEKVIEGEFIPNEKGKVEILKKVEKAINKMIWTEEIGQPKRGKQWEVFFEPVVDGSFNPVPSTFVIVIYIAPCLGGVFTEVPECYEMVDGKVKKMSFVTWKKRILQPLRRRTKEIIPHSVSRIAWSSDAARKAFAVKSGELRKLINNGDWDALSKECEKPQKNEEMKLLVLSKRITACYRRGLFHEARSLLEQYKTISPRVKDQLIFDVVRLHNEAALKRATGDNDGLKEALTEALSMAELIEPGLVTATVYVFAATVTDLISLGNEFSPETLSLRALEHSQYVENCYRFHADKEQKVDITLTTFYLGFNLSGKRIEDIKTPDFVKAKTCMMAVHLSTCEGNPLSKYREVQFKLVQSINSFRLSEVCPDKRRDFLQNAFDYANEAESLAKNYKFKEMVEWSKANKALCTEELVRDYFTIKEIKEKVNVGNSSSHAEVVKRSKRNEASCAEGNFD